MTEPEWQHLGQDDWAFGVRVRGLVREPLAEVYFDDDQVEWVWIAFGAAGDERGQPPRGAESSLPKAAEAAERALALDKWCGTSVPNVGT